MIARMSRIELSFNGASRAVHLRDDATVPGRGCDASKPTLPQELRRCAPLLKSSLMARHAAGTKPSAAVPE